MRRLIPKRSLYFDSLVTFGALAFLLFAHSFSFLFRFTYTYLPNYLPLFFSFSTTRQYVIKAAQIRSEQLFWDCSSATRSKLSFFSPSINAFVFLFPFSILPFVIDNESSYSFNKHTSTLTAQISYGLSVECTLAFFPAIIAFL